MTVAAISAIGAQGMDLSQLAAQYENQILSSTGTGSIEAADSVGADVSASAATGTRGAQFGDLVTNSLSQLEKLDNAASTKAIQAATGDLTDIQDYVIAATKAQTATELTATIRNKALDAFNEVMRMQL
jgi:flagellar hook-basal body complex protein FliE